MLKIKEIIKLIIVFGVLITPLLNSGEVIALLTKDLKSQQVLYTSIYVKILKDLIMLLYIFSLVLLIRKLNLINIIITFGLFIIVMLSIFYTALENDIYIIYGLRWLYPLFILIVGLKCFQDDFLGKEFERSLLFVFFFHLIVQIYQFFSGISWFGVLGEYSARNPGIFLLPNTAAFFTSTILYYYLFLAKKSIRFKITLILFSMLSVILAGSGTGIIVNFFILILYLSNKFIITMSIFALPIATFIFLKILQLVEFLRGEGYVTISGGTRLQIFLDTLKDAQLFSDKFGYFTNVSNLMGIQDTMIADSTYTSLVGNLGLIPFVLIIFLLMFLFFNAYLKADEVKLAFLSLVGLFSATTIILEAYPMNFLLFLFASKIWKSKEVPREHRV